MKKIIIKFSGGFGNQLFQYSLAKHLELDKKFNIIPDFNFFRTYKLHKNYIKKIGFEEDNLKLYFSSSFFPNKLLPILRHYLQLINRCKFVKENEGTSISFLGFDGGPPNHSTGFSAKLCSLGCTRIALCVFV